MKLLSFMLGDRPGAHAHIKMLRRKFRQRFWSLIHLGRVGLMGDQLFQMYTVLVRPVIKSNHVIYHSMLTAGQAQDLERMQKRVARLSYSIDADYTEVLRKANFNSLGERRVQAVENFVG